MNAHQRRKTKRELQHLSCPRCAKAGPHWLCTATIHSPDLTTKSLVDLRLNKNNEQEEGFWICDDMYGADGRRIDLSDLPTALQPMSVQTISLLLAAADIHLP